MKVEVVLEVAEQPRWFHILRKTSLRERRCGNLGKKTLSIELTFLIASRFFCLKHINTKSYMVNVKSLFIVRLKSEIFGPSASTEVTFVMNLISKFTFRIDSKVFKPICLNN